MSARQEISGGGGMLFSQMRPERAWADAFHAWYDEEHVPARLAVPGFTAAVRYGEVDGDHFLAVYHLGDMAALSAPAYRILKEAPSPRTAWMLANVSGFTRYTADLVADTGASRDPGACLFAVAFDVPAPHVEELDAWYDEEHAPLLREVPGWLRVRRYAVREDQAGPRCTRIALHDLASTAVLAAPEREAARATAWRARLAREAWFERNRRWAYRLRRAFQPAASDTASADAPPAEGGKP